MKRTIAIIPIALAGLAHAETINYHSSNRICVGIGSQESVSGTVDFDSGQSDGDGSLETWSGAAGGGVSAGGGVGRMDSIIGTNFFDASGSASATATFTNNLVFVTALGSSSHSIRISVTEITTFSFVGELDVDGTANAWARVRDGFSNGTILYVARAFDGALAFDDLITLGPGEYTIQLFANSNINLTSAGSAFGDSSYHGTFAIVPAPATAIAPLAFLIASTRRRR